MRIVAYIVIAMMVLSLLMPVLEAASDPQTKRITAWILVPAVLSDDEGRLINLTVTIEVPGSGGISVLAGGQVDETTRYSMEMAVYTAALLAGVDWRSINAWVELETLGAVAGPSGSFPAAFLAFIILTRDYQGGLEGIAMTGAISPDGLSASVGGIPVKCLVAQEEGLELVIPLSNYPESLEAGCSGVMAATGVMNATYTIFGVPLVAYEGSASLPKEFDDSMVMAARSMRGKALEVLSQAGAARGQEAIDAQPIMDQLERSSELESVSPYAAASVAFGALVDAYTVYYSALIERGVSPQSIAEEIRLELEAIQSRLYSMETQGSTYYIELLATAYTRLADAYSTLLSIDPANPSFPLAYAKARAESIMVWIETAERLRDVGPSISSEQLREMTLRFAEYAGLAMNYSSALAEYQIRNYDLPWEDVLASFIEIERRLEASAREYLERGNYIAALGFYREGLSRSLNLVFTFDPNSLGGEGMSAYMEELERIYGYLVTRLAIVGLSSGVAEAYRQYSEVLRESGSLDISLSMMEESVSSVIMWSMLSLISRGAPAGGEALDGAAEPLARVDYSLVAGIVVMVAVTAFMAGFLLAFRLSSPARAYWST